MVKDMSPDGRGFTLDNLMLAISSNRPNRMHWVKKKQADLSSLKVPEDRRCSTNCLIFKELRAVAFLTGLANFEQIALQILLV